MRLCVESWGVREIRGWLPAVKQLHGAPMVFSDQVPDLAIDVHTDELAPVILTPAWAFNYLTK